MVSLVREASEGVGDGEAFAALVRPCLAAALATATVVTGSHADGADAVQDALISAWRGLPGLRDPAAFPAWFRRHVVRSAIHIAERSRRHRVVDLDIATPEADALAAIDGNRALDREFERRQMDRAFVRLDPKDRLILALRHSWDLPVAEVAQALGIPEGTVKSRVHQALKRLRAAYEAEERR
jgi:RNA polymerase sigma-70 factor (ECF subfamily)